MNDDTYTKTKETKTEKDASGTKTVERETTREEKREVIEKPEKDTTVIIEEEED